MAKLVVSPIKVPDWPAADRHLWEQARKSAGPFDDGGGAAAWSASTVRHVEQGYGTFLAWSAQTIGLNAEASATITEEQLKAFLDAYELGRAPLTVATIVKGIAYYYRAVNPPDGLVWLTKLAHHTMNTAPPSRPKLPRMASIAELTELGRWLMAQGLEDLTDGKISGAQVYRDGLMISALAARPLRRRNLCALRLGHSFLREPNGFRVKFSGKETKKGTRLNFRYPSRLTESFETYLRDVRPVLLKASENDEGWLWIGRRGRRLPPDNVTSNITGATRRYLDRAIPPHNVRDCAATDIAIYDPAYVGITKAVLGHKTLASSQEYYNQAANFTAIANWEAVLLSILEPSE
jgi:integrase/recombinase XerC